jgi:hypothetical protein
MEDYVFRLDGMTGHDVACRLADAVEEFGPYAEIIVDDEKVTVRKVTVRICSDD